MKVQQVAKDLNVSHVLEGSVRRVGGQVRINAQLVDANTGGHIWPDKFDHIDAYDAYLRARKKHFGFDAQGAELKEALTLYQEAITKDPTFADAYAGDAAVAAFVAHASVA